MTFDLFAWLRRPLKQVVAAVTPKPKEPMSDERLALAISTFHKVSCNLKDATRDAWGTIMPVKVTEKFMGWGYVEGRTSALKVNGRIRVTEADDDMDFTEYCVLVDGTPCLLLLRKGGSLGVTIIAERDFLADVFHTAMMRCNNLEDFRRMPAPVQKIMHDVLEKVLILQEQRAEKPTAIDKMVEY
jgi:hypothetical protein